VLIIGPIVGGHMVPVMHPIFYGWDLQYRTP
jgi:hypothetical protein